MGGYTYDSPVISADGNTIYVSCREKPRGNNNVYAIHALDGRVKWKFALDTGSRSSAIVISAG